MGAPGYVQYLIVPDFCRPGSGRKDVPVALEMRLLFFTAGHCIDCCKDSLYICITIY